MGLLVSGRKGELGREHWIELTLEAVAKASPRVAEGEMTSGSPGSVVGDL